MLLVSDTSKAVMINTKLIPQKSTRTSMGVNIFTLKGNQKIVSAFSDAQRELELEDSYKKIKIPAAGTTISQKDKKSLGL